MLAKIYNFHHLLIIKRRISQLPTKHFLCHYEHKLVISLTFGQDIHTVESVWGLGLVGHY